MSNQSLINPDFCVGPPYIYATTHHEVANILKYSRSGCLLDTRVLIGGPNIDNGGELRSISIGKYHNQDGFLYVADATTDNSYVNIYGQCNVNSGKRQFIRSVVTSQSNPGANHAYGICFDSDNNVYVSFQHTDNVLRFYKDTFEEMPLPWAIRQHHKWQNYYLGTFVQFGSPNEHDANEQGVRSIIRVNDDVWIANEDLNGVAVATISTGMINNIIVVDHPIGLHYNEKLQIVFVGSKRKHWRGAVFSIHPDRFRIINTYSTDRMNHPSGITSHENILYVGEVDTGDILKFDIFTTEYLGKLTKHSLGEIEQLTLSDC